MTVKRDLKKRVRERQARTGESYTTALAHVLAAAEPERAPVPVLELVDLSAEATRLGLACQASMFPELAARVDGATVLARLRATLLATESDASTAYLRRVLLRGEPPDPFVGASLEDLEPARRFIRRARAGLGGVSEDGHLLALHVDGRTRSELVLCMLWPMPPLLACARRPRLVLWPPEASLFEPADPLSAWTLP